MAEVAQIKMYIINYSKTRKVYSEYKKSWQKNKYCAEIVEELEKHIVAKAAFDALGKKQFQR